MVGRGRGGRQGKGGGGLSSRNASARGGLRTSFVASTNNSHLDTRQRNGFTPSHYSLKDEARNTETYHSWNSDLKLRHSRVSFISAGTSAAEDLNPVIQKSETCGEATESSVQERAPLGASKNQSTAYPNTPDTQMSKMTLNDLQATSASEVKSEHWLESTLNRRKMEEGLESRDAINEVFSIDHNGADELVHTNLVKSTKRRVPSSTGSDSSEEIIIFAGRRQSYNKGDQERTSNIRSRGMDAEVVPKPSRHRSSVATVMDDSINVKAQSNPTSSKHIPSSFSPPDPKRALVHLSCHSRAAATTFGRRTRRRGPRKETKDERVLDDYISNLRDGGGLEDLNESSMFKQRDLGGSDTAEWQDEVVSLPTGRVEKAPTMESRDWDSADLEDFVELSTSDEALESIVQVLSRRERPSGIQYLVVGADCTVDDARWLPVHSLNFPAAEALIQNFEDSAELDHLLSGSDTSDASPGIDEQMALDLQEDLDDKEDQEDLEERRKARMTDEQVAKLLSKQEELGLGSDDVVLFDGNDFGPDSQKELQLDGPWERAAIHPAAFRSKKMKRSRSDFPSATAFADIVDQDPDIDFDIMDQQRLNLRKRPKGRRGKPMELSDSELELSIHTAWEKDRIKKKLRKQEREDLRAQGLLGKKNQPDLKAKYAGGISMIDVKKEIKDFLLSSMESLSLPPMAQGERKMVHEIANVFKLKSKSSGGGKSRFPILYRTCRTVKYNKETFKTVESVLSSGRFLPRMDKAQKKGALVSRGRRGEAANAGVSYRDGEVVGAAAPEIGQENRGRSMLEKMGWSTGTALGALNNSRGLVQPVAQVVKTSRSGLG